MGISHVLQIGATFGEDGVNIPVYIGAKGILELNGNINIAGEQGGGVDLNIKGGFNGTMYGFGGAIGLSPISEVKLYGLSDITDSNGINTYTEAAVYSKTGVAYAVVVTILTLYYILQTGGAAAGEVAPVYIKLLELLGITGITNLIDNQCVE